MGRHHAADDYEDDPNEPDESDMDPDEGEIETLECPKCGRDVYEQAEKCPHCGEYIEREKSREGRHPGWVILTTVVLLVVILYSWVKWGF